MKFETPELFLDKLNNWFNGLIALPLLAAGYGYLEIFSGRLVGLIETSIYVNTVVILIVVGVVLLLSREFKKKIASIKKENDIKKKLESYFLYSKTYFFKIFISSLITVIGMYFTGSISFAGLYAFQLFLLSVFRPSLLSVANKLGLKGDERKSFLNQNSFTIN